MFFAGDALVKDFLGFEGFGFSRCWRWRPWCIGGPWRNRLPFLGLVHCDLKHFFNSRFGLRLLDLGVSWVFHGLLAGRRFEVLTVVIDDGSW